MSSKKIKEAGTPNDKDAEEGKMAGLRRRLRNALGKKKNETDDEKSIKSKKKEKARDKDGGGTISADDKSKRSKKRRTTLRKRNKEGSSSNASNDQQPSNETIQNPTPGAAPAPSAAGGGVVVPRKKVSASHPVDPKVSHTGPPPPIAPPPPTAAAAGHNNNNLKQSRETCIPPTTANVVTTVMTGKNTKNAQNSSDDGEGTQSCSESVKKSIKVKRVKKLSKEKSKDTDATLEDGAGASKAGAAPHQNDAYDKQLAAFVKETMKIGLPKLLKDFTDTRVAAPKNMPKIAFDKNHDKNRYKDVICIDESRVVLTWPPGNPNDYIHANWVTIRGEKKYICTQGPLPKTVEDFWRMVFQEKCKGIVMLTEVMELGKKKCEQYWPKNLNETMTFGLCTIVNKKVTEVEKMIISTQLEITANGETLKCEHLLWTGWPDRGVPDNYLGTLRLVRKMAPFSPCIVHCSAGIGRTGTIVGLDLCQKTLKAGEKVDMHEICKELRKFRHGSVQTDVQFVFMHAVILKLAENKKVVTKEQVKPFFDEYTAYISTRQ